MTGPGETEGERKIIGFTAAVMHQKRSILIPVAPAPGMQAFALKLAITDHSRGSGNAFRFG